jgi:phospholipid-translocating ATPase
MLILDQGVERTYKLLNLIEFTSLRKRMTAVVLEEETNLIKVFIKGADNVIMPLLRNGQTELIKIVETNLNSYAKEGLRTLVIGEKCLS